MFAEVFGTKWLYTKSAIIPIRARPIAHNVGFESVIC